MTVFALTGARVFDGSDFHDNMAVVIDGVQIASVQPQASLSPAIARHELAGGTLAPGYIDVQVNGGGGALLNERPSCDVVRRIAESHRKHGTVGLLPTVITDAPDVVTAAIAAVREARIRGLASVLGIHIEGPFLDPARNGAHDRRLIRSMSAADQKQLAGADCGKLLLTVAPNIVSPQQIQELAAAGVIISLGHSNASCEQAQVALAAGATGFTHLFNAMSQLTGREPGMVGAALTDKASFIGIIADGYHVHDVSLKLAFAATSPDRFILVSDAMPPAAGGPDKFQLQGRTVTRIGDRLSLDNGTLAGSNLTMDAAVRYCVNTLKVELGLALRMASTNPARFLGLQGQLGTITPGARASLVHLDEELNVTQTWIEGT